jgi:hypothetical protein
VLAAAALSLLGGALGALKVLDRTKVAWALLCAGIALFLLGEASYAVQEVLLGVDMGERFPSISDAFWLLGYLPLLAGLLVLLAGYLRAGFPMGSIVKYLVAAVVVLGLGAFLVVALFAPIVADDSLSTFAKVCYLFYPIGDLVLFAAALVLIAITASMGRSRLARPWLFLAAGFVMLGVADITYSYLDWQGFYGAGHPIDIAWNAAYCLVGMAGRAQSRLVRSL